MIDLNFKIYDGMYIDPKEFFSKIKNIELNLERTMLDNCVCNLVSKVTGQELKGLLDATKEELETDDEYIMILKVNNEYFVRQEVYDDFEEEFVVNEWFLS